MENSNGIKFVFKQSHSHYWEWLFSAAIYIRINIIHVLVIVI
jgi:hypothetical protein